MRTRLTTWISRKEISEIVDQALILHPFNDRMETIRCPFPTVLWNDVGRMLSLQGFFAQFGDQSAPPRTCVMREQPKLADLVDVLAVDFEIVDGGGGAD